VIHKPRPDEVLRFWFVTAGPTKWWSAKKDFDEEIRERFGETVEEAAAGDLDRWRATARSRVALVIVLDQFSRNIFRGQPRAFAQDARARAVTEQALAEGDAKVLAPMERAFLYMPLMHAEDVDAQRRNVELCEALHREAPPDLEAELAKQLKYAKLHAQIIDRFGRFPHRNAVLGRESTAEEKTYLEEQGSSF